MQVNIISLLIEDIFDNKDKNRYELNKDVIEVHKLFCRHIIKVQIKVNFYCVDYKAMNKVVI